MITHTSNAQHTPDILPELFRVSYSKDGSLAKRKLCDPVVSREYARAEADRHTRGNRSVTILSRDNGRHCAENAGKWFLDTIVK